MEDSTENLLQQKSPTELWSAVEDSFQCIPLNVYWLLKLLMHFHVHVYSCKKHQFKTTRKDNISYTMHTKWQKSMVKRSIAFSGNHLTATGNHMPYRITQC